MKDLEVEKLISRAVDGELDAAGRAMLIRKQGAVLGDTREAFKEIGEQMREGTAEGIPTAEAMWQDVQRGMRQDEEPAKKPFWLGPWAIAGAAALAVAVVLPIAMKKDAPAVQTAATVEYLSTDLPGADIGSYVLPDTEMTVIWVFEDDSDEG